MKRKRYERQYNAAGITSSTPLKERAQLEIETYRVSVVNYHHTSQVFLAFEQATAQKIANFLKAIPDAMSAGAQRLGSSAGLSADFYQHNYVVEKTQSYLNPEELPLLQKAGVKVKVLRELNL